MSIKNKLFEFLDAQNLTLKEVEDLNSILDKISDFEASVGIELEEEQAIKWGMDYLKIKNK
jgi:hypothetical protein